MRFFEENVGVIDRADMVRSGSIKLKKDGVIPHQSPMKAVISRKSAFCLIANAGFREAHTDAIDMIGNLHSQILRHILLLMKERSEMRNSSFLAFPEFESILPEEGLLPVTRKVTIPTRRLPEFTRSESRDSRMRIPRVPGLPRSIVKFLESKNLLEKYTNHPEIPPPLMQQQQQEDGTEGGRAPAMEKLERRQKEKRTRHGGSSIHKKKELRKPENKEWIQDVIDNASCIDLDSIHEHLKENDYFTPNLSFYHCLYD